MRDIITRHYHLQSRFAGIFARDQVPRELESGFFYIVNSANRADSGEHWLTFFMDEEVEFMDSFGKSPEQYGLHVRYPLIMNGRQLQSNESDTCGHFVMFYLYFRTLDLSMETILSSFSENTQRNDVVVRNFVDLL